MTTAQGQGFEPSGTELVFGWVSIMVGQDELANNIPPGCDNLG